MLFNFLLYLKLQIGEQVVFKYFYRNVTYNIDATIDSNTALEKIPGPVFPDVEIIKRGKKVILNHIYFYLKKIKLLKEKH